MGVEFGYRGERLGLPEEGPGSIAPIGRRLAAVFIDWILSVLIAYGLIAHRDTQLAENWALAVFAVVSLLAVSLGTLLWLKQVGIGDKYIQQDHPDQQAAFEIAFTLQSMLCGAFTLIALTQPDRWKGRSVDLAGDELSMTETAEVFARVTQRPVAMGRTWLFMLRPRVLGTLVLAAIVTGLGLMLCVVPGIYLGLLFSFTVPVMADEGLFGIEAMRRSAELARYNPQHALDGDPRFKVFVIVFVGALLGYVISMLVQLPMMVVQQLIIVREVAGGRRVDPAVVMAHGFAGVKAGGLEPFMEFLRNLPPDSGAAIIYLQHSEASHVSELPQVLGRVTKMPVRLAVDVTEARKTDR